jgi:hypothetical protein
VNSSRRIAAAIALLAASCGILAATPVPDRTAETLQKLAQAAGPPCFEEPVRAMLVGMMKSLVQLECHHFVRFVISSPPSRILTKVPSG